jgi:hypothetical protein
VCVCVCVCVCVVGVYVGVTYEGPGVGQFAVSVDLDVVLGHVEHVDQRSPDTVGLSAEQIDRAVRTDDPHRHTHTHTHTPPRGER